MTKWQYTVFIHETSSERDVTPQKKLDSMGMKGWELVTVLPVAKGSGYIYHFKRPISQKKEDGQNL